MIDGFLGCLAVLAAFWIGYFWGGFNAERKIGRRSVWADYLVRDLRRQNAMLLKKLRQYEGVDDGNQA